MVNKLVPFWGNRPPGHSLGNRNEKKKLHTKVNKFKPIKSDLLEVFNREKYWDGVAFKI